jgi:DNA-binding IclR family transcriptional regulator
MTARNQTSVQTIDRLVSIIECFTVDQPTWSLTDMSQRLGLPKSTLHRFLVSLESHGLLRPGEADRRWRPGYRLLVWGAIAAECTGLRHVAKRVMEDLVAETGETALLTVYAKQKVVCVEKVETNQPVRLTLDVGSARAPHAGASSKVLMAYLPDEEIDTVIQQKGLPKLCNSTITARDELAAELAAIRRLGYAMSREETDVGAWGVATPIRDWRGAVSAAIGVAGPLSRFSDDLVDHYVACCRRAAEEISVSIGARAGRQVEASQPSAGD